MKKYIKAQAYSKIDIRDKIEDQALPIMEALAQLYLFPDAQEKQHWKQEVWANFHKMYKLKRTHKLPDTQFIYDTMWGQYESLFTFSTKAAMAHEYMYEPNESRLNSLPKLKEIMEEYFRWISKELSDHEVVFPADVYTKLDELGF